jgi:hypothetical protein
VLGALWMRLVEEALAEDAYLAGEQHQKCSKWLLPSFVVPAAACMAACRSLICLNFSLLFTTLFTDLLASGMMHAFTAVCCRRCWAALLLQQRGRSRV